MELFLNLVWGLVTVAMGAIWLRFGLRQDEGRRTQIVALVVLLLVLFPAISVSDDLLTLQNPAEADCFLRRHEVAAAAQLVLPSIADLPNRIAADLPLGVLRQAAACDVPAEIQDHPCLAAIDNRPPPAA